MDAETLDWHMRFTRQAAWTASLRQYIYSRVALPASSRVLDVGCGTGALLPELSQRFEHIHGLDIDFPRLKLATRNSPSTILTCADAHRMPFPAESFDLVLCHFLFLWVQDARLALSEMARLARPGGVVAALAEPDYGGRIDFPPTLQPLGQMQVSALRRQGADPEMGRKLAGIFRQAGLQEIETGVLGGQWASRALQDEVENEWQVLASDLMQTSEFSGNSEAYRDEYFRAWRSGERVLFVPTFYAFGRKA